MSLFIFYLLHAMLTYFLFVFPCFVAWHSCISFIFRKCIMRYTYVMFAFCWWFAQLSCILHVLRPKNMHQKCFSPSCWAASSSVPASGTVVTNVKAIHSSPYYRKNSNSYSPHNFSRSIPHIAHWCEIHKGTLHITLFLIICGMLTYLANVETRAQISRRRLAYLSWFCI